MNARLFVRRLSRPQGRSCSATGSLSPSSLRSSLRLLVATLIFSMLLAQWMGMRHRIEHANWFDGHPLAQLKAFGITDEFDGEAKTGHKTHSCALFDGTALADTVAIVPFILPAPTCTRVLALWQAFTSWDAPLVLHFSSRAPPPAI